MNTQRVYDFLGKRKLAAIVSITLVIASVVSLSSKGLVLGLDFTGGTLIEVGYEQAVGVEPVRARLTEHGFVNPTVVHFGSEFDLLIKLQGEPAEDLGEAVVAALRASGDNVELRRIEFVGPQVGEELRDDGGLGLLAALAVVMLYVAVRFQYKFSIAAVAALIHDVIITLGFFSLFNIEFDLTVLAAVLAVIGYSLNDTIIVFDRVRENFRLLRTADPVAVINESLTQTLDRTLVTSLTTLLVLFALFLFGGELIHSFATALIIGIVIGTYSSIYIAASLLLNLSISRENLMPQERDGDKVDDGLP